MPYSSTESRQYRALRTTNRVQQLGTQFEFVRWVRQTFDVGSGSEKRSLPLQQPGIIDAFINHGWMKLRKHNL